MPREHHAGPPELPVPPRRRQESAYNPEGVDPAEFSFPYPDTAFDFVFLTSVFTHMLPPDVRHYLTEIRRVIRPGGSCLMTFFLLNDHAREAIRSGRTHRKFEHEGDGYFYDIEKVHEGAVAYAEEEVLSFLEEAGFQLRIPSTTGAGRGGRHEPSARTSLWWSRAHARESASLTRRRGWSLRSGGSETPANQQV